MNKVDWQRWLMAIVYDATMQEDKQELTRKEKIYYNLYGAIVASTIGMLCWFLPNVFAAFIASIICFVIAARKLDIFWNKKKQWEKENQDNDYKAE